MSAHRDSRFGQRASIRARNPATGETLEGDYFEATPAEIDASARAAERAFEPYAALAPERRAEFLRAIAQQTMALGESLLARAEAETALPAARLESERARTVSQTLLFAELIEEGSWVGARIDRALPERKPQPRPDMRRMLFPVGPVAVFGASNFPLAFSVAGGDTVSALAAGCPVVVKAHPAHPGTSELSASAIQRAARETGMPEGVFSMLHGTSPEVGITLVTHPAIRSAAFTGSLRAGRTLYDAAALRPEPIPVFAEMGSSNPVFLLPGALQERGETIAKGFAASVTLGSGQFCTNPGVVVLVDSPPATAFLHSAGDLLAETTAGTMVHAGIKTAYDQSVADVTRIPGVRVAARAQGAGAHPETEAHAALLLTDAETYLGQAALASEIYGPASVAVRCASRHEMVRIARGAARPPHGHDPRHGEGPRRFLRARRRPPPESGTSRLQRLPDGRRGLPRDAARRPVPRDDRLARNLGRLGRDPPLRPTGLLPGLSAVGAARRAPQRKSARALEAGRRRPDEGSRMKRLPESIEVVDSHTEGEPTRVVIGGWPELSAPTMEGRREELATQFEDLWRAVVLEPRGHDAIVGALLTPPVTRGAVAGVIYFDNVGPIWMCGHGTIGVVRTLEHLGRISPGKVRLDTAVGTVGAELAVDGLVTIENVPARLLAKDVAVEVPGVGRVVGDVAYGGNWFFLARDGVERVEPDNLERLRTVTLGIQRALAAQGITGQGGSGGRPCHSVWGAGPRRRRQPQLRPLPRRRLRPLALRHGNLGEDGRPACARRARPRVGATGRSRSREASSRGWLEEHDGQLWPRIQGRAYVTGRATLYFDPRDPFRAGLPSAGVSVPGGHAGA